MHVWMTRVNLFTLLTFIVKNQKLKFWIRFCCMQKTLYENLQSTTTIHFNMLLISKLHLIWLSHVFHYTCTTFYIKPSTLVHALLMEYDQIVLDIYGAYFYWYLYISSGIWKAKIIFLKSQARFAKNLNGSFIENSY